MTRGHRGPRNWTAVPSQCMICVVRRPLIVLALAGCTFPEHSYRDLDAVPIDASSDNAMDATADTAPDALADSAPDSAVDTPKDAPPDAPKLPPPTSCPDTTWVSGCSPVLNIGGTGSISPVVDAEGKEFCAVGIRSRGMYVVSAPKSSPITVPASFKQKILVRAALGSAAFYVHVTVLDDPRILVDTKDLVQGDAVEIFLRGNKAATGSLVTDGARHIVIAPPSATTAVMAWYYVDGKHSTDVDAAQYAGRRVDGGYEVELHLPWTVLGNQPAPGEKVGFDVALDIRDDVGATGREVRAILQYTAVSPSPTCTAFGSIDPACDDRTWCLANAYL